MWPAIFDVPAFEQKVLVGRDPDRVAAAAAKYGWAESATDWRSVIDRDDIDIVDICAPGWMHAEIAIAALEAGKHVLVEKPLANTLAEAEAMTAAAAAARATRCAVHDRVQLPPGPRPGTGQGADRGRPARDRPARPRRLPAGLARGPGIPHDLAAEQGNRRLRGTGRHRLPRHRPGPVPARGPVTEVSGRLHTFTTSRPGAARTGRRDGRRRRLGNADARLRGHRLGRSLPRGHRTEELAQARDLRRQGLPPVRPRKPERTRLPGRHRSRSGSRASAGSWSTNPSTPTWRRGGRRATSSAGNTPSPTRSATSWRRSAAGAQPSPSFEDGLAVQRILAAVEESAAAKCATIQLAGPPSNHRCLTEGA